MSIIMMLILYEYHPVILVLWGILIGLIFSASIWLLYGIIRYLLYPAICWIRNGLKNEL